MKFPPTTGYCAAVLLCLSLYLSAPSPARANPLQSIGSGLKKAGNALNPFKKAPPPPAAEPAPPSKPKPAPAKATKPAPVTRKKPTPGSTTTTRKKTSSAAKPKPQAEPVVASPQEKPADTAPVPNETATPAPDATSAEPTAPTAPAEIPFGTPVMGRKGLVRSPYAETQGMVDVTDLPAGAKVKCPFTGKVFRVP